MGALLFGKRPPKLVDRRRYPSLKKSLKKLDLAKEQLADVLGAPESAFSVELCEGENASINRGGRIAFGLELLGLHRKDDDLLVAVLAHEIGHQPWTWPDDDLSRLTKAQLDALYREEEAKADRFAGRALADLGLDPDAICEFLLAAESFEAHKPSDYYPAETRAKMIRDAFGRRRRMLENAAKLNPQALARSRELR